MFKIGFRTNKKKKSLEKIREEVTQLNRQLLETGMDIPAIMTFWKDCMAEAEIRHKLPPCSCKDANQCDTWCRAKARFAMNPPP